MSPVQLEGKRVLVTGGTGSLGRTIVRKLLEGARGTPDTVTVFSRDEARQLALRDASAAWSGGGAERLRFRIGDVRRFESLAPALRRADLVIHAAAMKQVPTCEYAPEEAVLTNVNGAANIVRAVETLDLPIESVVALSTDKACTPVSVMGMTKALQERIFIHGNLRRPATRFLCVRYGNFLSSRGSVVPRFQEQIRAGRAVTVTGREMTRFLLSLDEAAESLFVALDAAAPGMIVVPRLPAARIHDVARALVGERGLPIEVTSPRPGERLHEVLINESEIARTAALGTSHFGILPSLPELMPESLAPGGLERAYSSRDALLDFAATRALLARHGIIES